VIPAFTDCHIHFSGMVRLRKVVDLIDTTSRAEAMEAMFARSRVIEPDEWVIAQRANHNGWPERALPTREELDTIPNPVVLHHISGHVHIVNSRAIEIIGVSAFRNVKGGVYDSEGRFTGVIEEGSHDPVTEYINALPDQYEDWIPELQALLEIGVAEIHPVDPGMLMQHEPFDVYQRLKEEGKLPLRVKIYYDQRPVGPVKVRSGFGDGWVGYAGHKIFLDGALGSRTAALRERYSDVDRTGVLVHSDKELYEIIVESFRRGLQVMAHVIGDRGLDQVLAVLERLQAEGITSTWPVKLTHVEMCHPDQIARIARLNVVCDIQMAQLPSDAPYLPRIIGEERMQHCFVLRSMFDAGIVVTGSADAPVESTNPLTGIQAAVLRCPSMNPSEAITLAEALRMYTINAQRLMRNEAQKGLLKVGHLADITVFREDLFTVGPEKLIECKVAATIVDGKIAYRRPE
jgi:predicted amidohydrolase YtcJ